MVCNIRSRYPYLIGTHVSVHTYIELETTLNAARPETGVLNGTPRKQGQDVFLGPHLLLAIVVLGTNVVMYVGTPYVCTYILILQVPSPCLKKIQIACLVAPSLVYYPVVCN